MRIEYKITQDDSLNFNNLSPNLVPRERRETPGTRLPLPTTSITNVWGRERRICIFDFSAVDGYSSDMNIHHGFPSKRYARIETHDFPEKFSIISRLKKESFIVGPGGDVLRSSVLPQVQVKVPEGAVSSGTKITLQVSHTTFVINSPLTPKVPKIKNLRKIPNSRLDFVPQDAL